MSTIINMKLYVQIFLRHCTSMLYCIYLVQLNIVLVALNVANNEYKTIGTGIESNKNISPVRDRTRSSRAVPIQQSTAPASWFVLTHLSPLVSLAPPISRLLSFFHRLSSPLFIIPLPMKHNSRGEGWSWRQQDIWKMTAWWGGVRLAASRGGICPLAGEGWFWPPDGVEDDRWAERGEFNC